MKKFEILEHKADAKFRAYGDTIEEAFENAALASFSIMTDIKSLEEGGEEEFSLKSENLESLLYSFLDHLIYLRDYKELLFYGFQVEIKRENKEYSLKCTALKAPITEDIRYTEVKAVTYNEMEIEETDSGYEVQAVLDL